MTLNTRRRDRWLALLAFLLTLAVLASNLTNDSLWGDDFAGYINQGIALAEGRLEEQFRLNVSMHPSDLPDEAGETLVYSMGYPLILSVVYRLAGFDRTDYTSLVWYKLPSILALAGLAAVLYFFYRRRFPAWVSLLFSVAFCVHPAMRELVKSLYSDAVFLFFCLLALSMTEVFLSALSAGDKGRAVLTGTVLGLAMGMTCLTRLNGAMFCAGAALLQLLFLRKRENRRGPWALMLPWAVLAVFMVLFTRVLFPPATSNLSDFTRCNWPMLLKNLEDYLQETAYWVSRMLGIWPPLPLRFFFAAGLGAGMGVFFVLGVRRAWRREIVYLALLLGMAVGVVILPYNQGLRYCFPVLPFVLLFAGHGAAALWNRWRPRLGTRAGRVRRCAALCAWALLAVTAVSSASGNLLRLVRGEDVRYQGGSTPFSTKAVDMYRYIRENTPPESVIAFYKPRVLYLATERESFNMLSNGHDLARADYYLWSGAIDSDTEAAYRAAFDGELREEYANGSFTLYIIEEGTSEEE